MTDVKNDFARLNASFRDEYTYQSSESYVNKMKQLLGEHSTQSGVYNLYSDNDKNLEIPVALKGYVPDGKGGVRLELPYTLMHRIGTLHSKDGHRLYEFLIEYDVELPSVGIYYGCRGVTVDGFDHTQEIEQFRHDYDMVETEIRRVLNNTFLDNDGNAFQPDYFRTQLNMIKNAKRRDFETEIKELSCVIKSWCDS